MKNLHDYRRALVEWIALLASLLALGGYIGLLQYQDHPGTESQGLKIISDTLAMDTPLVATVADHSAAILTKRCAHRLKKTGSLAYCF
ncbi:MAG: hypothetical protein JZU64_12025 [Rhodoferax sp.]|jgi:hypothetical protein|nr:hypothetical protein [Rhodoferax sp.]